MRKRVVLEHIGRYVEIDHGPFRPRARHTGRGGLVVALRW
jgi:hypothetical protein